MSQSTNVAPSIISANLHIVGNLSTEGEIQVDGTIDGDVSSKSLTIGENAKVCGEVVADEVEIRGSIEGRVVARSVKLSKTAHVVGDIVHEVLSIESGAYIEGQLQRAENLKRSDKGKATFGTKIEKDATNAKTPDVPPVTVAAPDSAHLKTASG